MDDLISRQKAIEILGEHCKMNYNKICGKDCECIEYMALRDLPSAQRWIPCDERLPEDDETVLVTRDDGTCKIATFEVGEIENGWQMDSWYTEDNVTAWMPLPDCYQGDGKGEGD